MVSTIFIVLAFLIISSTLCVEVRGLSEEEEDLELEQQLKLLNKQAVKTIQTEYGDIYDCVDFYKQPAFDHPLLKDHDFHFEMKPNKITKPKRRSNKRIKSAELKGVGCPKGTVPIRRTTKEDLARQKILIETFDPIIHPQTESEPGLHYAGGRIRPEWLSLKLGGAYAHLSLYQTPLVGPLQFSSGLIKISNGSDFIKAGWTVNPTLYGDNRCRLFTYLHTRTQHCFNARCPGFVLINPDIPLDHVFPEVSAAGVSIVENKFYIFRDQINGNWWLNLGDNDTDIGFWPSRIFTDLAYTADDAFWGGELFSLPDMKSCPMGNGIKLQNQNPKLYAYCRRLSVIDDDKQVIVQIKADDELVSDIGRDYVSQNYIPTDKYWGRTVMFSGPGDVFGNN